MELGERRIRSLRLSGPDDTQLLQARYRLEEAFRTASFPGLPLNRQLLVRRLDLGTLYTNQPPIVLAGKITELVRGLAAQAVHIDSLSNSGANVVWFNDLLDVYGVLLQRLLDGDNTSEWYWRTLFPNRTLKLDSATIEMIFTQAVNTSVKRLAPSLLLQEIISAGRINHLFSHLTSDLVERLCHAQGLSPYRTLHSVSEKREVSAELAQTIATPNMSLIWRYAIRQAQERWGEQDIRTIWVACNGLFIHRPAWLDRQDVIQRVDACIWLQSWGSVRRKPESKDVDAEHRIPVKNEEKKRTAQTLSQNLNWKEGITEPELSQNIAANQLNGGLNPTKPPFRRGKPTIEHAGILTGRVQTSEYAGVAYLVPLLHRLSFADLLAKNEQLVELDFPRQLIWALIQRLEIARSDPLFILLNGFEPADNVEMKGVILPHDWYQLTTKSGRPLNGCAKNCRLDIRLFDLVTLVQFLTTLYLRRFCGLSLRGLITRPGGVLLTGTHWDVFFHIEQVDLRLRRVALDCDPGWVSWLGRVVQFHFDAKREWHV